MVSLKLLAEMMYDCRRFKSEWHKVLDEIARGQPQEIADKLAEFGNPLKGVVGQILYDITGSDFGRVEAGIISAETAKIMMSSDKFVDETDLTVEEKINAVRVLFETMRTGKLQNLGYDELTAVSLLCLDLYERISKSPHKELFVEECRNLAGAVIEQLEGKASLDISYRIGGGTATVINIIPYCLMTAFQKDLLKHQEIWEPIAR